MRAQILSIKGVVKCQSCGCECPIENSYCGKCGAHLEKPEPPVEETADDLVVVVDADEPADDDDTVPEAAAEEKPSDENNAE